MDDRLTRIEDHLRAIREALASPTPARRYLSVDETARYCGVSSKTIRRMLASGRLNALRPYARKVVIDIEELDAVVRGSAPRRRR